MLRSELIDGDFRLLDTTPAVIGAGEPRRGAGAVTVPQRRPYVAGDNKVFLEGLQRTHPFVESLETPARRHLARIPDASRDSVREVEVRDTGVAPGW